MTNENKFSEIYRLAFEKAKDIVLLFDMQGNIIEANAEASISYGYSKEELLNMTIFQLRAADKEAYINSQFDIAIQEGIEFVTYHFKKDGTKFPVEVKSIGIEKFVMSIIRDISSRQESEGEIRHLASIVEHSKDAIFSKDLNNIITSWNRGAELLYGFKKEEITGGHISLIIPKTVEEDTDIILERVGKGFEIDNYETIRKDKQGKILNVSLTVSPIYDLSHNLIGTSTITRDITEKVKKEKELLEKYEELNLIYEELMATEEELRSNYIELEKARNEAEKANLAKNKFLASISHEIRTPMNGIIGIIDLLSFTDINEMQKEYIGILKESSRLMLSVINNVLDMSRIESGEVELYVRSFDYKKLIEKIIMEAYAICSKKNLSLEYYIDPTIEDKLIGDEVKLNQILLNLINNAIKFTDIGKINIRVRKINEEKEKVKLEFSVEDTGCGIEEAFRDNIFERFSQEKTYMNVDGTGLGLSICKELVTMMNGEIWFTSKVGAGSTFYFTAEFTLVKKPSRKLEEVCAESSIENELKRKNILIVENNEISLKILSEMVKELGYDFIAVKSGKEALQVLETRNVDLIMMDIYMAELDGFETTKIIRDKVFKKYIPIVAMTAYVLSVDKKMCIDAGMDDYIMKPFNLDALTNVFLRYLK
jgi:PAS domain S-box-containing protein